MRVKELFCILILVAVVTCMTLSKFINPYTKRVSFIVRKLYINKSNFFKREEASHKEKVFAIFAIFVPDT